VKKLGFTDEEFAAMMTSPAKSYWDYPAYGHFMNRPSVLKLVPFVKKVVSWFK
jgi:hypothetical protein